MTDDKDSAGRAKAAAVLAAFAAVSVAKWRLEMAAGYLRPERTLALPDVFDGADVAAMRRIVSARMFQIGGEVGSGGAAALAEGAAAYLLSASGGYDPAGLGDMWPFESAFTPKSVGDDALCGAALAAGSIAALIREGR